MEINKKKVLVWSLFGFYMFIVTQIILVKRPRLFVARLVETFYRHDFDNFGKRANYQPFRTIRQMLFVDFHFFTALVNIGGNIFLFIPLGIFFSIYFKAPHKTRKTIISCFVISSSYELFQLITACGYFDVDDLILNTLGGAIGLWIYSLFITYGKYSQKKMVVTYAPN